MPLKLVELQDAGSVLKETEDGRIAKNVTIVGRGERAFYFTFDVPHPTTGKLETYAIEKQRGGQRIWADPRVLFRFLQDQYGIDTTLLTTREEQHENGSN